MAELARGSSETLPNAAALPFFSWKNIAAIAPADFLTLAEQERLASLHPAKMNDWLLGRYAIKSELSSYVASSCGIILAPADIEIVSIPFAAPVFRIIAAHIPKSCKSALESKLSISIAHSRGVATAGIANREK